MKMLITEVIAELMEHPNEEIEYAILKLMVDHKLDSHKVFDLYMKAIEIDNQDKQDRLAESNTSILDLLMNLKEPKSKREITQKYAHNAIHRALYNLNTSKQFYMNKMNEKYGYNEEEAQKLSWYWRKKHGM